MFLVLIRQPLRRGSSIREACGGGRATSHSSLQGRRAWRLDWQFLSRLLKLTRVNYGQKTILTSVHDSLSSCPWQRMPDQPLIKRTRAICCRGSRLQGICNLSSSDGLLRSRCSPAGMFHSGCVQLDFLDDACREMRCGGRLSRELQRSSSCHTAA